MEFSIAKDIYKVNRQEKCTIKVSEGFEEFPSDHFSAHSVSEISLFTSGTGIYTIDDVDYEVYPGDIIFVSSGQKHKLKRIDGCISFINIWFDPESIIPVEMNSDLIDNIFNTEKIVTHNKIDANSTYFSSIRDLIFSIHNEASNKAEGFNRIIESQINILTILISRTYGLNMAEVFDVSSNRQYYMDKSLEYIQDRLNQKFTLAELARVACLSTVYYGILFKRYYGMTPWEYICQEKMKLAVNKLKNSNANIKTIAFECGYDDYPSFSKAFKKYYGISPRQYRDSERSGL